MSSMRGWLLIGLLLILNPVHAQPDLPALYQSAPCPFTIPDGLRVDCGFLSVPENRADPASRLIQLAVAIVRSPSPDPQPDPIVYLEGGPGGSPLRRFPNNYSSRYLHLLQADRDLILIDQRGTGYSQPALDCPEYQAVSLDSLDGQIRDRTLSASALSALRTDALIACGQMLAASHDLNGYTSAQSAADIEDLRVALGIEQVNLWGISYGTRLALTILRDYPASVRSAVLDSVYPLDANLYLNIAASMDQALERLFAACAADAGCALAYPQLRTIFYETVAALDREPALVDAVYAASNTRYDDTRMDGGLFISVIFQLLYDSRALPYLPRLIVDAYNQNYDSYRTLLGAIIAQQSQISTGMNIAVQCQDEILFSRPGQIEAMWQAFPLLRPYATSSLVTESLFDVCAAFRAQAPAALENQPVASSVPTLLFSGTFDPITPPVWGAQAAQSLTAATLIELPATGHGATATRGCAQDMMLRFIQSPSEALDTTCLSNLIMQFDVPIPQVPVSEYQTIDLSRFGADAITSIPSGWREDQERTGRYLRGASPFDKAVIQFTVVSGISTQQQLIRLFTEQNSITLPDVYVTLETDYTSWRVYPLRWQGESSYLAFAVYQNTGLLVFMIGDYDLRDQVLFPALRAFAPRSQTG